MAKERGFGSTVLLVGAGVLGLVFISNAGTQRREKPVLHEREVNKKPRMADGAINALNPSQYPKMVDRIGMAAFQRANALIPKVGLSVASQPGCDELSYVSISDQSTSSSVQFFADCENGFRQRYSEAEAMALGH